MSIEITHRVDGTQIVSPLGLREALKSAGEHCYCQAADADPSEQWDVAGPCPEHGEIWIKSSGDPHPDDDE